MHRRQMILQTTFPGKPFATDIASEPGAWIMHSCNMILEAAFLCKSLWTNVTLEGLDVTNTMNRWQVYFQVAFLCKLPAANLALVSGVRMLGSRRSAAALSMRRVVVSADRWLVTEHHPTDLALDTSRPSLQTRQNVYSALHQNILSFYHARLSHCKIYCVHRHINKMCKMWSFQS